MNAVDKKLLSNKCTLGDGGGGSLPPPCRVIAASWPRPDWILMLEHSVVVMLRVQGKALGHSGTQNRIPPHTASLPSAAAPGLGSVIFI